LESGVGVVTRLTTGWEKKWYTVVMDNFSSSPMLFQDLLSRGFYACRTIRQGRIGYPSSLNIQGKGVWEALEVRVHKDRQLAAIHWQDTKGVYFLSSAADPMKRHGMLVKRTTSGVRVNVSTSPVQEMYSKYMRGVDTQDQLRGSYTTQIFTKKWWHRIIFFLSDTTWTNAYIMYSNMSTMAGVHPMSHYDFQLIVAMDLMGQPLSVDFRARRKPRKRTDNSPVREKNQCNIDAGNFVGGSQSGKSRGSFPMDWPQHLPYSLTLLKT
jgi:hypothetical protein